MLEQMLQEIRLEIVWEPRPSLSECSEDGSLTQLDLLCFFFFFCLFLKINLCWSIVDLQYCVSFTYIANWFIYIYPLFFRFFPHIGHYRVFSRVPWAIYCMYLYFIYSNVHMSFPISQIISSLHDLLCLEQSKVNETKRCMRVYSPGEEWWRGRTTLLVSSCIFLKHRD